jgi:O-antigen/teichoic acid export membrane protein
VHVFGSKWHETVVPLQILSFSVMLHILVSGNTALLRGLGLPGLEMKQQVLKAVIFLPSLAIGIYYGGIIGAAWAILLNKLIGVLIAQYTFTYLIPIKISAKEFVIALKAPLTAAACAFLAAYILTFINIHYLIASMLMCICYCAVIWLFMQNELKILIKGITNK